jgi:hypothetical protein
VGQSSFDHLLLIHCPFVWNKAVLLPVLNVRKEEIGSGGKEEKEGRNEICRLGQSFYRISTRADSSCEVDSRKFNLKACAVVPTSENRGTRWILKET